MGKKAVSKYLYFMSIILTFILMVINLIALNAGNTNPIYSTTLPLLAMGLPLLIIINAVLLLYWLIRFKIWVVFPIIAVAFSYNFIGTMYKFGSPDKEAKGGIGIATYNVRGFNQEQTGTIANDIKEYMMKKNVDVICFQEYSDNVTFTKEKVSTNYKEEYPYMATGKSDMVIFSKYPIRDSKTIEFEGTNNSGMWADIDVNGKLIRVFNVHMQTTGINRSLRQVAKKKMAGESITDTQAYESVADNYVAQFKQRAGQAITVSNEVRMTDRPVLLCGDFNDIPYSYTYHLLKSKLEDGFRSSGKGFMYTYRGAKSIMRIDYIFHSPELTGVTYFSDDMSYSDHNPVIMRILPDGKKN